MSSDLESFKQSVLDAISAMHQRIDEHANAIVEYRKSVNNAINLISEDLRADKKERYKRQKRNDYRDIAIGCFFLLTLSASCSILSLMLYILWSGYGR